MTSAATRAATDLTESDPEKTPEQDARSETLVATETLVEEVSIDGMCGVY